MNFDGSVKKTSWWDHVYFWSKELMILVALVTVVSVSFCAFFFLPEGYLSSEFLTLLFY